MRTAKNLMELPVICEVFNLAGEAGIDGLRVLKELEARDKAQREAREYQARMQRTFEQCPGFVGGDAPSSEVGRGRIVIEPRLISEALPWLKRRFFVNEDLELNRAEGLVVELAPRPRKAQAQRTAIKWAKPEQFKLGL